MSLFCAHNWKEISKELLPSPAQQLKSPDLIAATLGGDEFYKIKVVIILACEICGKLDKTVEVNP